MEGLCWRWFWKNTICPWCAWVPDRYLQLQKRTDDWNIVWMWSKQLIIIWKFLSWLFSPIFAIMDCSQKCPPRHTCSTLHFYVTCTWQSNLKGSLCLLSVCLSFVYLCVRLSSRYTWVVVTLYYQSTTGEMCSRTLYLWEWLLPQELFQCVMLNWDFLLTFTAYRSIFLTGIEFMKININVKKFQIQISNPRDQKSPNQRIKIEVGTEWKMTSY